jgi:hypothetical protein
VDAMKGKSVMSLGHALIGLPADEPASDLDLTRRFEEVRRSKWLSLRVKHSFQSKGLPQSQRDLMVKQP